MRYETIAWKTLRWIMFIPLSFTAFIIARGLFNVLLGLYWGGDDEFPFMLKYVAPLIVSGIGGYYGMAIGHAIAPSHKKYASLSLLVIYTMIAGAVIIVYCFGYVFSITSLLEAIGQLIGCIICYIKISEDGEPF